MNVSKEAVPVGSVQPAASAFRKSLALGSATALATRGAGIALSMATGIITARALGPEGKGILAFLSAASAFAVRAGSLGLDGSFAHFYLVRRRPLADCLGAVAWMTLVAGIAAAIVSELLLLGFPVLRGASPLHLSIPFFAATPAFFILFMSTFVFFGLGRAGFFAAFDVAYRATLLIALAAALLLLNGTVRAAVWVQISVSVAFAVGAALAAGRAMRWRINYDAALVREMLRYGWRFYSYGLLRYALVYGGVLVAGILLTPTDAGLFAVSLALGEGMTLFAGTINLAFYPAVASASDRRRYTASVGKRMFMVSCALAAALALAARPLIAVVYGPAFAPSLAPFLYMLPGLTFLSAEQGLSSYFAARGMPWRVVAVLFVGTVGGAVLAVVLSRYAGIVGLAIATGIAHTAVSGGIVLLFARDSDENDPIAMRE